MQPQQLRIRASASARPRACQRRLPWQSAPNPHPMPPSIVKVNMFRISPPTLSPDLPLHLSRHGHTLPTTSRAVQQRALFTRPHNENTDKTSLWLIGRLGGEGANGSQCNLQMFLMCARAARPRDRAVRTGGGRSASGHHQTSDITRQWTGRHLDIRRNHNRNIIGHQ